MNHELRTGRTDAIVRYLMALQTAEKMPGRQLERLPRGGDHRLSQLLDRWS